MTTLRHQIASLQPKKFALCFFPIDNSLEPCKTSLIKEGAVREGNMVRLYWDKKSPDLPAKVIFLEDSLKRLEEKRNEVLKNKTPLCDLLTEEDKTFIESWRLKERGKAPSKRRADNAGESVPNAKKKASTSLTSTASSCTTTSSPGIEIANSNLSAAASFVSSCIPTPSQSSTFSAQSIAVSPVQPADPGSFHSSKTPTVESVSNNIIASILPALTSSLTSASSTDTFPALLPLPSPSFDSTIQPSLSLNIPGDGLQPIPPLNISAASDDLSFSTFFTDISATSTSSNAAETLSFSPVSTNSNLFSFSLSNSRSFDSMGQSYPRSSTPVLSGFNNLSCLSKPSRNFGNILPGQAHPESQLTFETLLNQKVDSLSLKVDMVLENQRAIIDYLTKQQPARSMMPVPVTTTKNKEDNPSAERYHPEHPPTTSQTPFQN